MPDGPAIVMQEIAGLAPRLPLDRLEGLVDAVDAAPAVHVMAAGRTRLIAHAFAMRLMQLDVPTHGVGEVTEPALRPGDLLIAMSGTGQTRTTLTVAEAARTLGAQLIVLTARAQSPLARLADQVVVVPGVPRLPDAGDGDASRQPPGALFEQMLFCFLEEGVVRLARRRDPDFARILARHANLE